MHQGAYHVCNACIYKKNIKLCLFLCPTIALETLDRFATNFNWGTFQIGLNFLNY